MVLVPLASFFVCFYFILKFTGGSVVKNPPANAGLRGRENPLEKEMATYSRILAYKIPWTEEPAGYSPWGHKSWTHLVTKPAPGS